MAVAKKPCKSKAELAPARDGKGRFRPGRSGNPAGRPVGAAAAVLRDLRQWAECEALPLMKAAALAGDMDALKTLVALALPRQKPIALPFPLPGGPDGVIAALERGELDADTARTAMDVHMARARITELEELEKRMAALESALAKSEGGI